MPRYSSDRGIKAFLNRNRGKVELSSMLLATGIGVGIGALLGTLIFPGVGTAIGAGIGAGFGFSASLLGVSLGRYYKPKGMSSQKMAVSGIWLGSWGLGLLVGGLVGSVIPGFGTVLGAVSGGLIAFAAALILPVVIETIGKRYFRGPTHVMEPQYIDVELMPVTSSNQHEQSLDKDPASSHSYTPVLTGPANTERNISEHSDLVDDSPRPR